MRYVQGKKYIIQHRKGLQICFIISHLFAPFMETKTFCANCKVHCYKKDMIERIQEVMKFSGPRMLFHRPGMAIRHVIETRKEKRRLAHAE